MKGSLVMNLTRSIAKTIGVLIVCGFFAGTAHAQDATCADLLAQADQFYERGGFDEAIARTDQCLALTSVSETERRTAYRLKGLSYIGKGLEVDARESIRRLLELVPNYEPDPVMDPPNFVDMITEMRDEMTAEESEPQEVETADSTPPPVVSTPTTGTSRRKKGGRKWLLGGLGVAAAGGLVAILASGGGGDGGGGGNTSIADPPPLPQ